MKIDGTREILLDFNSLIPVRIGYSLGTVYYLDYYNNDRYELYNFGYCPSTKEFYTNRHFHISKKIVDYFEAKRTLDRQKIEGEMQEIGILNGIDIDFKIKDYEDAKANVEVQKVLTLNSCKKRKKHIISFYMFF